MSLRAQLSPVYTEAAQVRLASPNGSLVGVGGGHATPLDDRFRQEALDAPDAIDDYPAPVTQSGHPAPQQPQPSARHSVVLPTGRLVHGKRRSVMMNDQEVPVEEFTSRAGLQTWHVVWRVTVDGAPHEILVKHGVISGRRRVYINGVLVHESRRVIDSGSTHDFFITSPGPEQKQRKFTVVIELLNHTHYEYKLLIDGMDLEHVDGVSVHHKDSQKLTEAEALLPPETKSEPAPPARSSVCAPDPKVVAPCFATVVVIDPTTGQPSPPVDSTGVAPAAASAEQPPASLNSAAPAGDASVNSDTPPTDASVAPAEPAPAAS